MAEYRIGAVIDPSGVTQGAAKVEQDLHRVDAAATATKAKLEGAFSGGMERAAASLAGHLSAVGQNLGTVATAASNAAAQTKTLTQSVDQVAASATRATTVTTRSAAATRDTAAANQNYEAMLRRVLLATDAEAAEQMRLNSILVDAKRLLDAGVISQERFTAIQQQATKAGQENTKGLGAQKAGYQQLGFQLNDIVTSLAGGANPLTVFAQQGSQLFQALSLLGGGGGGGGGGDSGGGAAGGAAGAAADAISGVNDAVDAGKGVFENAKGATEKLAGAVGGQAAAAEASTTATAGNSAATSANATAHTASAAANAEDAAATGAAAAAATADATAQGADAAATGANAVSHFDAALAAGAAAGAAALAAGANVEDAAAAAAAAAAAHINALSHADATVALVVSAAAASTAAAALTADAAAATADTVATGALTRAKAAMAAFMAGPWSAAVIAGVVIIGALASKFLEAEQKLDDLVDKLKKDAAAAALAAEAHDIFAKSADGVADSIRAMNIELKKAITTQQEAEKAAYALAKANLASEMQTRQNTLAEIEREKARLQALKNQLPTSRDARGDLAPRGSRAIQDQIAELTTLAEQQQSLIDKATENVRMSQEPILQRQATEATDAQAAATGRYERALEKLNKERAKGVISADQYLKSLIKEQKVRDDAIEAARKAEADAKKKDKTAGLTTFISPIAGARPGSGFGPRSSPGGVGSTNHAGVDYPAAPGTPVRAAAAGTIDFAGVRGSYGNLIIINNGAGTTTRDAHLSKLLVSKGQQVQQGDIIGLSGGLQGAPGAGNAQGRGHLHHEVRINGKAVNPLTGKFPTDAADAADKAEIDAEKRDEAIRDYVAQVVDEAAARGYASRSDTVAAQIERKLADFQRRFDRAATPDEKKAITDALTEADAREIAARFDKAYVQPIERLQALQGKTGLDRDILNRQLEETARIGRELTPIEAAQIDNSIRRADALEREAGILESLHQPLDDYKAQVAALNKLLKEGTIDQVDYNAELGKLGAGARDILSNVDGVDPKTGKTYDDVAATAEEDARYAEEVQKTRDQKEELLKLGIDYDALELAQKQEHARNLAAIEEQRTSMLLQSGQQVADSLLQIAESSVGKQNAVYKTLFIASKAFAIADAILKIQTAIANAAALPPPANIPFIIQAAALGASIISNIQSVALNLADGGLIRGPGGPRGDKIPVNASDGEYMVKAEAVARGGNLALLDAMNNGRVVAGARRQSANDNAGGFGRGRSRVTVHQYPGTAVEVRDMPDDDHIEFIARQAVAKEAPRAVATALRNPNSRVSKAMSSSTTARRKRG